MKCPYCKEEVGIELIQHIRTECEAPRKKKEKEPKESKQLSFWPKPKRS